MRNILFATVISGLFLCGVNGGAAKNQDQDQKLVCPASTLRAVQPIPKLRYKCRSGGNDSDDAILKWPERIRALNAVTAQLKAMTQPAWWQADPIDLDACDFKKRPGKFTASEKKRFEDEYFLTLFGNENVRLVVVKDPCYQTEYSGSVFFLIARNGASNIVTKAYDGFFSRVDNPVTFDWANEPNQQVLEISTGNSMPPSQENFYFSFDRKTHRVQPINLFKDGKEFANRIYSEMMMSSDEELPDDAGQIIVIKDHKLAPTFNIYIEDDEGTIAADGKKFKKTTYRWTGTFYESVQNSK